jgi:hypothetical protein
MIDGFVCRIPLRLALGVYLVAIATAGPVRAQGVTATISGTVKDTQGAVVPGATVTLISESKRTQSAPSSAARRETSSSRTSPPTPTPSKSRFPRSRRCCARG